eukprot:CAMPEP_0198548378 /NCGR_PEP_ID=MMETSP1462-20131121/69916_1 /TAXON_ID=1333877 /ORGANISM="Brandtodinium nutriculum, Strain RCC3387" /LENGTH=256 /DNA_ID=CAMNT_0044278903 /DNA_START=37 /DNA_END=804 /DNA_ORIENTATION=+
MQAQRRAETEAKDVVRRVRRELRDAKQRAASADARLREAEADSRQIVDEKLVGVQEREDAEFERALKAVREDSANALDDVLLRMERHLREEMEQKIADAKREFKEKLDSAEDRIHKEHRVATAAEEKRLRKHMETQVSAARREAAEACAPKSAQEAHDKAAARVEDVERRLRDANEKLAQVCGYLKGDGPAAPRANERISPQPAKEESQQQAPVSSGQRALNSSEQKAEAVNGQRPEVGAASGGASADAPGRAAKP